MTGRAASRVGPALVVLALCHTAEPAPAQVTTGGGGQGAYEQALSLLADGRAREARESLEALADRLRASNAGVALLLGVLRRNDGDLAGAARAFAAGLRQTSGTAAAPLWTELAVTRSWQGELAEAEAAYRRALTADAGFRPARAGLARVLRWRGESREAGALYRQLMADGGDPVEAYVGLGFLALAELRADEAEAWFAKALALAPDNAEAADGMNRLGDAARWELRWNLAATDGLQNERRLQGDVAASLRLSSRRTVSAAYSAAPAPQDVVQSDPSAPEIDLFSWTLSVGWKEQLTRSWNAGLSFARLASPTGSGLLATAESATRLSSAWSVNAGVRGGSLPTLGRELVSWAGVTRVSPGRRALSVSLFHGTDLREASSWSVLVSGSAGIGEDVTVRATAVRGWTTSVGFTRASLGVEVRVSDRYRVNAEAFRFAGAYRSQGLRLGARMRF